MSDERVTRVEVINQFGRMLVLWGVSDVVLSYQDHGRTLKIFLRTAPEDAA